MEIRIGQSNFFLARISGHLRYRHPIVRPEQAALATKLVQFLLVIRAPDLESELSYLAGGCLWLTSIIIFRPQESVIRHSCRASLSRLTNQVHGILVLRSKSKLENYSADLQMATYQKVLNSLLGTDEKISSSALLMNPASIRWSLVGNLRFTAILIDLGGAKRLVGDDCGTQNAKLALP